MKKYILDLKVVENSSPHPRYCLLKLTQNSELPEMLPGQFAEIRIDGSKNTFLRRPISINYVDYERNEVWFLVAKVGEGTKTLAEVQSGRTVNVILPLGNGFTPLSSPKQKILLVGGGVGIAPLLYYGKCINDLGAKPTFLLGAKSACDLLELDYFHELGTVYTTTEDGSMGEKGFVTQVLESGLVSVNNLKSMTSTSSEGSSATLFTPMVIVRHAPASLTFLIVGT